MEWAMDYEADQQQGGRLRLRRRLLVLPGPNQTPYAWRLAAVVDGMAGAVTLDVDMGAFRGGRPGDAEMHPSSDMGEQLMAKAWVEGGLAVRSVTVHAYRPWPVPADHQDEHDACPFVHGGRCWSQQLHGEHDPATHELLVRLVQPGGPESVLDHLEQLYREEFGPALPERTLLAARAREATALAEARQEGAQRAARMAAEMAEAVERDAVGQQPRTDTDAMPELRRGPDKVMLTREAVVPNEGLANIATPFMLQIEGEDRWIRVVGTGNDDRRGLHVLSTSFGPPDEPPTPWELRHGHLSRVRPVA